MPEASAVVASVAVGSAAASTEAVSVVVASGAAALPEVVSAAVLAAMLWPAEDFVVA
jgi:hypothetical protein